MNRAGDWQLGYRADIEGLRAVAILLVVGAHARIPGLDGGFIGVDVFFVLSGYLITGLLLQQMNMCTFDLADFYARRLRRLLPGLLVMLGVSCIFGYLLLAPDQHVGQAQGATGAALWLSNFVFAFGDLDYFGPDASNSLFLHTWSLGVEEQFYLVWPLLLVLAANAQSRDRRRLVLVLCGVFAVSLAFCVAWTRTKPLLAFYMMPTRAWQFALGALTFLAANARYTATGQERWKYALGWSGLAMIIAAAICYNERVPYPGLRALLPSLGAAAVLAAGVRGNDGVARVLALRPMQAIGRVSYAWYLWHWPVLLLGAAVADLSLSNRLELAVLSLAIGAASYHFVEKPIRRRPPRPLGRHAIAIGCALALMISSGALAVQWRKNAQARMDSPELARYEHVRTEKLAIYAMGCDQWYYSAQVNFCHFGAPDAEHTVVAVGDSVGLQWFPAYREMFVRPGWRLLVATKSSCPMVDESLFYARIGREYTECSQWRRTVLREIAALHADVVLVGSTHTTPFSQAQWTEGTARVIKQLAASSTHVYLIRSTPVLPFDGPSCLEPRTALYAALAGHSGCTAPAKDMHSDEIYQWLGDAIARFDNVSRIDMNDVVCPHEQCSAERDGAIVFRDSQHLTSAFVQSIAGKLWDRLIQGGSGTAKSVTAVPQSSP